MGLKQETGGEPSEVKAIAPGEPKSTRDRKPYQKPAFRFERVFETMALSCGKIEPTTKHCRFNRKVS
jgi:G:T/U-mismatch repair DNA glycosylase